MIDTLPPLPPAPLRIRLDGEGLTANWRTLARRSGQADCGAAVKANAYGLGAREVVRRLREAGCRDFFVATWREAADIADLVDGVSLSVLHGVRDEDMEIARAGFARPVLNSAEQIERWVAGGGGAPCDVMVDTGMNRLGLRVEEVGAAGLDRLHVVTLMSHLSSGDEVSDANARQRDRFKSVATEVSAERRSLANSAGIYLGRDYAFDLTRPGLALYGGMPRDEASDLAAVVAIEAQIVQRRHVYAGEAVGYGESWRAAEDTDVVVVNLGYADGYLRAFGGGVGGRRDPGSETLGRISMDLTALRVPAGADWREGEWLKLAYDLPSAARATGLSQYELLTLLGGRYDRVWSKT